LAAAALFVLATSATAAATSPCSLVTNAQATRIVGTKTLKQSQGPLGPTCIYSFKHKPTVTLTIEALPLSKAIASVPHGRRFKLQGRVSYCGTGGHRVLFASLPHSRVLSVLATCGIAKQFATRALLKLHL
jgi:hypothetical protein